MDSKTSNQHPADTVPTNVEKPVDVRMPEKLEQNTPMGKFSGHTSEAK